VWTQETGKYCRGGQCCGPSYTYSEQKETMCGLDKSVPGRIFDILADKSGNDKAAATLAAAQQLCDADPSCTGVGQWDQPTQKNSGFSVLAGGQVKQDSTGQCMGQMSQGLNFNVGCESATPVIFNLCGQKSYVSTNGVAGTLWKKKKTKSDGTGYVCQPATCDEVTCGKYWGAQMCKWDPTTVACHTKKTTCTSNDCCSLRACLG